VAVVEIVLEQQVLVATAMPLPHQVEEVEEKVSLEEKFDKVAAL